MSTEKNQETPYVKKCFITKKWHIFKDGGVSPGKLTNGFDTKRDAWSNYSNQSRPKSIAPCDFDMVDLPPRRSASFEEFRCSVLNQIAMNFAK